MYQIYIYASISQRKSIIEQDIKTPGEARRKIHKLQTKLGGNRDSSVYLDYERMNDARVTTIQSEYRQASQS